MWNANYYAGMFGAKQGSTDKHVQSRSEGEAMRGGEAKELEKA